MSYIVTPSEKVRELAQATVDGIRAKREQALRAYCADIRESRWNRFWRWVFRREAPTDAQIRQRELGSVSWAA
jgi:hypothetical protein